MTTANTTETTTETAEVTEAPVTVQALTAEQEIAALRSVHTFLSTFDRVPGSMATTWGQALDTIAVVANSLIAKNAPATTETTTSATSSAADADTSSVAN
jgi:hypothetical protein